MTETKLKAAVIGVGHLGKNHARIYRSLDGVDLVAVCDIDEDRAAEYASMYGCKPIFDYHRVVGVDLVSIVTPTASHFEIAEYFLKNGVHVLVEKPMCATLDDARHLRDISIGASAILQVGHVERFNPAVIAVRPHVQGVRYIETSRISPFSFRSIDVGVVMDMMIHDLDIVLDLVGERVESVNAVGVSLSGGHEDIATSWLSFPSGAVAVLKASRMAMKTERIIRVFTPELYISLDYAARKGRILRKGEALRNRDIKETLASMAAEGGNPLELMSKMIVAEDIEMASAEPLEVELLSFLDCIRNDTGPPVTADDGYAAMRVAFDIMSAIEESLNVPH